MRTCDLGGDPSATLAGVEEYQALLMDRDFLDDRGVFWGERTPDDYLSSLKSGLQIQWTFSKTCNFRCVHCFNGSGPDWKGFEADPFRIVDNILTAKPYNVCLCGGEPFTWKPFFAVVEKLRSGGVPLVSTVTNGYLATPERIRRLHDSGLTHLQISLDGTSDEEFIAVRGKHDGLTRATAAVEEALRHPWGDFSVSFTPTRKNVRSWKAFCRHWASRGVTHLRSQPFMPIGMGKYALDLAPTDEEYLRFHMDIHDLAAELQGVFIDWGDPLEHIWTWTRTAAPPWSFGIQTDGWFELSCYVPALLGSALEHSIEDFWALGMKTLWGAPVMRRFADTLTTMRGMSSLELEIYKEESLHVDVFDPAQLALFLETDDLATLRALSHDNVRRHMARWAA